MLPPPCSLYPLLREVKLGIDPHKVGALPRPAWACTMLGGCAGWHPSY